MPSVQPAAMAPMPPAMPVLMSAPPSIAQMPPINRGAQQPRQHPQRPCPSAALVIQP